MLRDWLFYKVQRVQHLLGLPVWHPTRSFESEPTEPLKERIRSDLGELFLAHQGRSVTKWAHYLDLYDHYFARFRNRPVNMLEIGVAQGGSIELWREYFGPDAKLFGIDINPDCRNCVDSPNQVRIGSQADTAFLRAVVAEMGAPDIVLDDGSHIGRHQIASFRTLWPLLRNGGLYVIEDVHTSYWRPLWHGGYGKRDTAIGMVKQLLDDMHGWFHQRGKTFANRSEIRAIHAYDSIVFIEKKDVPRPAVLVRPSS